MLAAKSELNYYPELERDENRRSRKPNKNRKKKRRPKRKKTNSSSKLIYIFIAMVTLGISLIILSRYAEITLVRTEITKLEEEKLDLEKTKTNLIADLEGIKSSGQIAEDAILKLGMDYPKENQIAYISLKEKNKDLVEDTGIIGKIKSIIIK